MHATVDKLNTKLLKENFLLGAALASRRSPHSYRLSLSHRPKRMRLLKTAKLSGFA
jgi:hypothetical protein